jgi:hypothetical protein
MLGRKLAQIYFCAFFLCIFVKKNQDDKRG